MLKIPNPPDNPPSLRWLILEVFLASILCSIPILWTGLLNETTLSQGLILACILLVPSEIFRQFNQEIKAFLDKRYEKHDTKSPDEEYEKSVYCILVQPIIVDFIEDIRMIHRSFHSKPKWFYIWQMVILFIEYAVAFFVAVLQAITVLINRKIAQVYKLIS